MTPTLRHMAQRVLKGAAQLLRLAADVIDPVPWDQAERCNCIPLSPGVHAPTCPQWKPDPADTLVFDHQRAEVRYNGKVVGRG